MKTPQEIRARIKELKRIVGNWVKFPEFQKRYNEAIKELEWVLK